jgi:hypothetical protein
MHRGRIVDELYQRPIVDLCDLLPPVCVRESESERVRAYGRDRERESESE